MKHTRFEYIGPNGREITMYGEFEQSVQDDGQTLKVFGREAVAGWRPIETAPKDGTSILVSDGAEVDQAEFWDDRGYWVAIGGKCAAGNGLGYDPTHWMPLPPAPGSEQ